MAGSSGGAAGRPTVVVRFWARGSRRKVVKPSSVDDRPALKCGDLLLLVGVRVAGLIATDLLTADHLGCGVGRAKDLIVRLESRLAHETKVRDGAHGRTLSLRDRGGAAYQGLTVEPRSLQRPRKASATRDTERLPGSFVIDSKGKPRTPGVAPGVRCRLRYLRADVHWEVPRLERDREERTNGRSPSSDLL